MKTFKNIIISILFFSNSCFSMSLSEAVEEGNFEYVKNNLTEDNINEHDTVNWTALHSAANSGEIKFIEYLLSNGASIDAGDIDDITPLHIAVNKNQYNAVSVLLNHGANPNIQDNQGFTALHCACSKKNPELIQLLLIYNANPHLVTQKGYTAVDIAQHMKNNNIATLINNYLLQEESLKKQMTTLLLSRLPQLGSNSPAQKITDDVAPKCIFEHLKYISFSPENLNLEKQEQTRTPKKHTCVIL